jgi:hypothetical protein
MSGAQGQGRWDGHAGEVVASSNVAFAHDWEQSRVERSGGNWIGRGEEEESGGQGQQLISFVLAFARGGGDTAGRCGREGASNAAAWQLIRRPPSPTTLPRLLHCIPFPPASLYCTVCVCGLFYSVLDYWYFSPLLVLDFLRRCSSFYIKIRSSWNPKNAGGRCISFFFPSSSFY